MTKQEFITENTVYLDDRILANLEQIPESAWGVIIEAVDIVNCGGTDPGIDCDVTITRDTLDDFEEACKTSWRECRKSTRSMIGGLSVASYLGVQMHKGGQRRDIAVVDCGEIRVCLG